MFADGKKYGKLFFKLLLLAVYFAFFTVQLSLRYTSAQSQQSLEYDSYQQNAAPQKSFPLKSFLLKTDKKKDGHHSYLNKRFHPKNALVVPAYDFQLPNFYSAVATAFFFSDEYIADIKINSASLRGPPSLS